MSKCRHSLISFNLGLKKFFRFPPRKNLSLYNIISFWIKGKKILSTNVLQKALLNQ